MFENTVTEKVITLPPSSREGADNESSGAKRKCVLPVASPSSFSQIPHGAASLSRSSQIPCGADVERYKLSSDFYNCALDWGNCDDKIDWDALTNGDID